MHRWWNKLGLIWSQVSYFKWDMGWYHVHHLISHTSLLFKATFKQRNYWSTVANLRPLLFSLHNTLHSLSNERFHVRVSWNMEHGALIDKFLFCTSTIVGTNRYSSSIHPSFRIGKTSLSLYCSHIQSLLYSTSKGESWEACSPWKKRADCFAL